MRISFCKLCLFIIITITTVSLVSSRTKSKDYTLKIASNKIFILDPFELNKDNRRTNKEVPRIERRRKEKRETTCNPVPKNIEFPDHSKKPNLPRHKRAHTPISNDVQEKYLFRGEVLNPLNSLWDSNYDGIDSEPTDFDGQKDEEEDKESAWGQDSEPATPKDEAEKRNPPKKLNVLPPLKSKYEDDDEVVRVKDSKTSDIIETSPFRITTDSIKFQTTESSSTEQQNDKDVLLVTDFPTESNISTQNNNQDGEEKKYIATESRNLQLTSAPVTYSQINVSIDYERVEELREVNDTELIDSFEVEYNTSKDITNIKEAGLEIPKEESLKKWQHNDSWTATITDDEIKALESQESSSENATDDTVKLEDKKVVKRKEGPYNVDIEKDDGEDEEVHEKHTQNPFRTIETDLRNIQKDDATHEVLIAGHHLAREKEMDAMTQMKGIKPELRKEWEQYFNSCCRTSHFLPFYALIWFLNFII